MTNTRIKIISYLLSLALVGVGVLSCGEYPTQKTQSPSKTTATAQAGKGPQSGTTPQTTQSGSGLSGGPVKPGGGLVLPGPVPPAPVVPQALVSKAKGIYRYDRGTENGRPVIRYAKNNVVLSRQDFIHELALVGAFDFRSLVNDSIASLPSPHPQKGYMVQAPVITNTSRNSPFYFVAIVDNGLSEPNPNASTFTQYLSHCRPVPAGANRGGEYGQRFIGFYAFDNGLVLKNRLLNDVRQNRSYGSAFFKGLNNHLNIHIDPAEIMVIPCPIDANLLAQNNKHLGHIYTFAKAINDDSQIANQRRLHSFWYTVGEAARRMLNNGQIQDMANTLQQELYLSTHGHGVSYLHFRVENRQRYYHQVLQLLNEAQSIAYYNAVFP